ncbi:GTP cyclohydrolase II [Vibrio phage PWH3a-P1]|uniref:GTP cyclohydrolase II n=1 Tax=Vibrio phage PWH3a-P1 TaxID=754058 RepID=UPI0002C10EAC|nr:GTP cyclohydrolase II [Vibrio phage PWH3a-P1]AGH32005.1 GTP cyclohydrolase II [Vibrio phage PWH3a-P1]
MKTEKGFREEYSFLSNFAYFETPMKYGGLTFPSNEHFYQAMKFSKDSVRRVEISNHPSKGLKKYVNSLKSEWRKDWDSVKLDVMLYGLRYKFSEYNPILRQKLIDTKGVELIEYNWWGDKFFGVCLKTGEGENHLGKLLMQVREEIS